ncbi:hypothetical protein B0H19DRAFT_1068091 [Mycena capillaripes]|nr:hypothetical protein B0H19DRAFT_1068091 [Mycena capillaripes]
MPLKRKTMMKKEACKHPVLLLPLEDFQEILGARAASDKCQGLQEPLKAIPLRLRGTLELFNGQKRCERKLLHLAANTCIVNHYQRLEAYLLGRNLRGESVVHPPNVVWSIVNGHGLLKRHLHAQRDWSLVVHQFAENSQRTTVNCEVRIGLGGLLDERERHKAEHLRRELGCSSGKLNGNHIVTPCSSVSRQEHDRYQQSKQTYSWRHYERTSGYYTSVTAERRLGHIKKLTCGNTKIGMVFSNGINGSQTADSRSLGAL